MEQKRDIFISYKNDGEGRNFAARLCEDLKKAGYTVYYNPNEQHAGSFPERLRAWLLSKTEGRYPRSNQYNGNPRCDLDGDVAALDPGNPEEAYQLANLYYYGLVGCKDGCRRDYGKAFEHGMPQAKHMLEKIEKRQR